MGATPRSSSGDRTCISGEFGKGCSCCSSKTWCWWSCSTGRATPPPAMAEADGASRLLPDGGGGGGGLRPGWLALAHVRRHVFSLASVEECAEKKR
ncbi:hypothetical protein NL676_000189 [Syzygium grande]|nr:hypothetical protein NL676_000189 [Syzygium grande]